MKRMKVMVAVLMVFVLLTCLFPKIGNAYVLKGYKFTYVNMIGYAPVSYKWGSNLGSGDPLRSAWTNAVSKWHNAQSKVKFSYSSNSDNVFNTYYLSTTAEYGKATTYHSNGKVTKFYAYLNEGNPSVVWNTNVALSVAVHELGHTMGLDDHSIWYSIMNENRDRYNLTYPTYDDVSGIHAIY